MFVVECACDRNGVVAGVTKINPITCGVRALPSTVLAT